MNASKYITKWLVLGPVFDPSNNELPEKKRPKATQIILDIENDRLSPPHLSDIKQFQSAPKAGDDVRYGNGHFFKERCYTWRVMGFDDLDWEDMNAVGDNLRRSLKAKQDDTNDRLDFAGKPHALAFFLVYIWSPDECSTSLHVRSDDAVRIWLNSKELDEPIRYVGERNITDSSRESCGEISFQRGWNILLVATANWILEWGLSVRIADAEHLLITPEKPANIETHPNLVKGTVLYSDGKPFKQGLVRAYNKYLRSEARLGQARIDDKGCYKIHYSPEQYCRTGKGSADLLVRTFSSEGEEVAHSAILFNAGAEEIVDLVVGNETYRGLSEYEQLVELLAPACREISFSELKEDEKHQDISFLSGESGADPQQISTLATAHRLQEKTDLDGEVFYGLIREGIPTELPALLMQSPDLLRRALVRAVEENIIPIQYGNQIDDILDRLQGLIIRQAFEHPSEAENQTRLSDLLGTVLEEDQQHEFISAYVAHKGTIKEFWKGLKERDPFREKVQDVQFTFQSGVLTRNHLPLIKALQRKRHEGKISGIAELACKSKNDWHKLIVGEGNKPVGFPSDVPGEDDDEKAYNYAKALANTMEDSFPTAFVSHRLKENQLEEDNLVSTFLQNNPQFDLKNSHLETYLADNPDSVKNMIAEHQEMMKRQLSAVQRVYKVAPRYDRTNFLLEKGLDSAYAISRVGEKPLALMYGDALGGQTEAIKIAKCAKQVSETVMALLPEINPHMALRLQAIGEIDHKQIEGQPDWSRLFGSLDLCECRHCNSVYGPAAYLVDILHFLKDRKRFKIQQNDKEEIVSRTVKQKTNPDGTTEDKTVQDVLFERRPDLEEIELTCENTQTPVPYVDLVNEILEDFIAPPKAFAPFTLNNAAWESDLDKGVLPDDLKKNFQDKTFENKGLDPQASVRVRKKGCWWTIDDLSFSYTVHKEDNNLAVTTRGRQTSGTREELEANPQYLNPGAYEKLRTQVFPWQSPFDLWAEEARAYLDHLGVKRSEIMETFLPGDRKTLLGNEDIAREYLGLTKTEADLIIGETTSQSDGDNPGVWNLWGFAKEKSGQIPDPADSTEWINITNQQDWLSTLKDRVDLFLQQSGLKYKDLLDLLVTNTINPVSDTGGRAITIQSKDRDAQDTCELNQLTIDGLDNIDGLEDKQQISVKIVRFVRLWRKLGLHFFDLDRIVLALGTKSEQAPHIIPSKLDKNFLVHLSHVMRLHHTLKVPIEELAAWWVPKEALCTWWTLTYIDHHAEGQPVLPSLYTRLFRNKSTINPLDPAFTENPLDLKGVLKEHVGTISAALGISAEDVLLLNEAVITDGDTLSLVNLSELFRHARLAKALKLKIRDYLSVLAIHADGPFAGPLETVLFVEHVGHIRASGFSIAELDYLLRHTKAAETEVAPTDEEIAIFLGDIRSGLQAIAAENTFHEDPVDPNGKTVDLNGDLTRAKLAQLNWEGALIDKVIATFNDAVTYRAPFAGLPATATVNKALPAGFEFPNALREILTYDKSDQKLKASCFLAPAERSMLINASDDQNYRAALKLLFKQQDEQLGSLLPNDTDELHGTISYDQKTKELCFQGVMTKARKAKLNAVSNAPKYKGYKTAVEALFDAPRRFVKRNMQTFSVPEYVVKLDGLPATLEVFPPSVAAKIYYDKDAKQLRFRGAMTQKERDILLTLSNNAQFQTALNKLFAEPDKKRQPPEDSFLLFNEIDKLFDTLMTPDKRFEYVLQKLFPYLHTTLGRSLVVQKLGVALGFENEAAEKLLTEWIDWPAHPGKKAIEAFLANSFAKSCPNQSIERKAFALQFDMYLKFHKISIAVLNLKLSPKQLRWLFEYGSAAKWPDMNQLTLTVTKPADSTVLERWERLWRLCRLRDMLPRGEELLDKLLATAAGIPAAASDNEKNVAKKLYVDQLMTNLKWTEGNLEKLIGIKNNWLEKGDLNKAFPADFCNEEILWRLHTCFSMLKRLGMSAMQCNKLTAVDVDVDQAQRIARDVRQAVRAKYDDAQWLKLAKPLRNVLREKQRSALVAYLLAHPDKDHPWRKVNDIYSYFLIDVEMSPCQMTSRIKQATLSVQLFVQRSLMGLEPEVLAGSGVDEHWLEWKWMKNYRVWEANRKVFLYPENWIEPELRDDKSPFFKALESELMQSDLTKETAEDAFRAYLEKLDQVARLEIVGMHHQVEKGLNGQTTMDILHVFGRTHAIPHVYYYRQLVDGKEWTAWKRIDLDIEGDHLIPVVWNHRLYLFWPTFTEKAKQMTTSGEDKNITEIRTSEMQPERYWEIKLAWSERKNDKWANKSLSTGVISIGIDERDQTDKTSDFFFRALVDNKNNLHIVLLNYFKVYEFYCYPCKNENNYEQYISDIETTGWTREKMLEEVQDKFGIPPAADAFKFYGCGSKPIIGEVSALEFLWDFDYSLWLNSTSQPSYRVAHEYMWLKEKQYSDFPLYLPAPHDALALEKTPGKFRILPHSDGKYIDTHPFFFLDDKRTFLVVPPERIWTTPKVTSEDEADPDALETIQTPELLYEIPPVKDLLGPIIDIVDPAPFEPSVTLTSDGNWMRNDLLSERSLGSSRTASNVSPGLLPSPTTYSLSAVPWTGSLAGGGNDVASSPFAWWRSRQNDERFLAKFRERKGYRFETFYHPYVCAFVKELNAHGVDGLLHRPLQLKPHLFLPMLPDGSKQEPMDFNKIYAPTDIVLNGEYYPEEVVDFSYSGGYSLYNWELFFHTPFLIANRLSQNQRFEEAQKWFHYIFDPTDTSMLPKPERYWRTKPFFETTNEKYQNERIQNLLRILTGGKEGDKEYEELISQVRKWRKDPFKPHLIARLRTTAYQKSVVMKYIDNLIAWGDQLFRRDTMESVNEATQLYILAADLLGKRPEEIPPRTIPTIHTYKTLAPKLGEFSNALVQIEEFIPPSAVGGPTSDGSHPPVTLLAMFYFCVPKNKKLLGYWDTVEDRLFKIRHCMNIEGVVRQLPLFAPPIDPGLLVKAAAAGLDISSALNDINAPLPYYRFHVMAQKATELCAELKSLGASLLSALEKRDAEELARLRAGHEVALLKRVEQVKKDQIEEARESLDALHKSRDMTVARYLHYQKLLGVQSPNAPSKDKPIPDHPSSPHVSIKEEGGVKMIPYEQKELHQFAQSNLILQSAWDLETMKQAMFMIPQFKAHFWGIGVSQGGLHLGYAIDAIASYLRGLSADLSHQGSRAATLAKHALRAHDWTFQNNQAAKEIMHIDKQIAAAEIRMAITERELENHRNQIEQAEETEQFLKDKYTNQELYNWMVGQIAGIYFQSYQLAYDVAKRSERAYRHELGLSDSNFIQFGYWDSLKKGLLSGEHLFQDIKRMEVSYLEKNRREYEIPKSVSLLQVDPLALVKLRATGSCTVSLPEELFDMGGPGEYFRRIKNIAVTIPCVTGPYTGVNCKLTLLKSSIRRMPTVSGDYARGEEDDRFIDYLGSTESIVVSGGRNDSGLFETNLRDERYLPFEGSGTISEWRLELPANPSTGEPQQFDYNTISDVILHIRYTARDGGALLRQAALNHFKAVVNEGSAAGMVRLFSVRHEFPTEWAKFLNEKPVDNQRYELALTLRREHYPFWSQDQLNRVLGVDIFARSTIESDTIAVYDRADKKHNQAKHDDLKKDRSLKDLFLGKLTDLSKPERPVDDQLTLYFEDAKLTDLWIAVTWSGE